MITTGGTLDRYVSCVDEISLCFQIREQVFFCSLLRFLRRKLQKILQNENNFYRLRMKIAIVISPDAKNNNQ